MNQDPVDLGPFVKIYGKILRSSVWLEPLHVRVMWISLLASANADGVVLGSVRGLAHAANVTPEQGRDALEVLSSPDPDSSSPEHDGRRIEVFDGGVRILNHSRYRESRTVSQVKAVRRTQRWREKKKAEGDTVRHRASPPSTLTRVTTDADADLDQDHPPTPPGGEQDFALEPPPSAPARRAKPGECTDEQWQVVADAYAACRDEAGLPPQWGPRDVGRNRQWVARAYREGARNEDWLSVMRHKAQAMILGEDPKWSGLAHVVRQFDEHRQAAIAGPGRRPHRAGRFSERGRVAYENGPDPTPEEADQMVDEAFRRAGQ